MKILSIYPYTHISSAALMIDNKIIAACSEERLNRFKMSTDFPFKSINWCLNFAKIKLKEIDLIAIPWNPSHNINNASSRWTKDLRWRGEMLSNIPINLMKILNENPAEEIEINFSSLKIKYLNHHECHAASAYFTSPFKNSKILTIDGHGEIETCFLGYANKEKIEKLISIQYPHSVGLFYGTFTEFLGFKPDSDEWKVMALSSYANKKNIYDNKIKKIYLLTNKGFELDLTYFDFYTFDKRKNFFSEKFKQLFGSPRNKKSKILKQHLEIAGAMQRAFEDIVFHLLKILNKIGPKSENVVLAGGAAMNCVFNGLLDKSNIFKNNFIPPYPDDSGVSIGALLLANNKFNIKKSQKSAIYYKHNYFGPSFSNFEIEQELKKSKIKYKKISDEKLYDYVAQEISGNKLIGWFQGRMEFSHRALGNRSILGDPRDQNIKDKINKAIKFRENFRPFAPSVIAEYAHEIFDLKKGQNVFFMEKAVKIKKNWKKIVPGVVHVDDTCRVQTVDKDVNEKFYKLINSFYKKTKVPLLLNTSFNLNGEPIVCNPNDAIRTFFSCGLDILVLGNYIITK